jgi:hypothetical protein
MAGIFLTTPALQIFLLWPLSPLSKFVADSLTTEVWISPLSHAILLDSFLKASSLSETLRRRGIREVERHRRQMDSTGIATYPLPTHEALHVWSYIRSLRIDIPAYSDGVASYQEQNVGPDELLVFATAAAFSKPLIGPAPSDPDTVEYLKDVGITFYMPPLGPARQPPPPQPLSPARNHQDDLS